MAGDWIKMRTSLLTNPKVNGIAKELESDSEVTKALSTGFNGVMSEIVNRNVMRYITVTSLLIVWSAANEHTKDGVFKNSELSDLDDMVGIPNFGFALESVGWAIYDELGNTVTLPNFNEYNTSGSVRSANGKTGAQRQKEYRERRKLRESNVNSDVTSDITSDRREEKRREENNTNDQFEIFYKAYPRKVAKPNALKAWLKKKPDLQVVLKSLESYKKSKGWENKEFIPHPATWINGERWADEVDQPPSGSDIMKGVTYARS
jgi:hypothetical protein